MELEGGDLDLIYAAVVIGSEVTCVETEQASTAFEIEHIVKLPEIALINETPIQFNTEFDHRRHAEIGEIGEALNITLCIDVNFDRVVATLLIAVGGVTEVDRDGVRCFGLCSGLLIYMHV